MQKPVGTYLERDHTTRGLSTGGISTEVTSRPGSGAYRSPVPQIHSFPVGVVSGVETSTFDIELIGKYEYHLVPRFQRLLGVRTLGCVFVYEAIVAHHVRNLASTVDSAEIEAPLVRLDLLRQMSEEGIPCPKVSQS